jgi:hypothetical protein
LGNGINGYPISKFSKDYFEVFIENPKKNCWLLFYFDIISISL